MTESKYEAMARASEDKHNQWRRLDSETNLTEVTEDIPGQISEVASENTRLAQDLGLITTGGILCEK